jgi:hypothetical protein
LSELAFADEVVSSASVAPVKENIVARRTVVYQTLMDPTVVRIEGEKAKSKLFNRFLFKLGAPEEIEFVSVEKYYEPYVVVSGRHLIDYYRRSAYSVRVDKGAKEVILFGRTFMPRQSSFSADSDNVVRLEGEERLVTETRGFFILNQYGQDSKLSQFPSAPSEEDPQKLIKLFKMPEISPEIELDVVRRRIIQRPNDANRVVNEEVEIDERSVIYTPRFKLTYSCPRIGKEASMVFDGVTLEQVKQNESVLFAATNTIISVFRRVFSTGKKWILKGASIALDKGKSVV